MVGDAKEILAAISTRAVAYPARLIDGDSDEPADRLPVASLNVSGFGGCCGNYIIRAYS